ncbi:MAG: hypothetical protein Q7W05_01140, partial [Deltaproteobacteria bacterium]|nr:hypothetical protein [Deltaproteobacteria bacterium]
MELLQSQKNSIFDFIAETELSPHMFIVENKPDKDYVLSHIPVINTIVKYKGTSYFFEFLTSKGQMITKYSPGKDIVEMYSYSGDWVNSIGYFK